jgi:mono/diheme cytochrome c family protein
MSHRRVLTILIGVAIVFACAPYPKDVETNPAVKAQRMPAESFDSVINDYAEEMIEKGRKIFRFDTFGSEAFWGDKLKLHEAIAGEKQDGIGPGLTPKQALQLGLKVDQGAVPAALLEVIKGRAVSLENPETTLELLRANAVVGVTGFFEKKRLRSIGIQCAFCHSTVDDSFARGIGRRLDGWPNRDLDVGAIVALAPNLKPMAELLKSDEATVRKVLMSWGPGKYDAELNQDGKAFRPDGKSAATVLPAAFGLAGVHLHTYTGWGSVTYWNAYVANTQMVGQGTFFDPRLKNQNQYPVGAAAGFGDLRHRPDLVTEKLAALHFYQLAIPAPTPPKGFFNKEAASRGKELFNGKATCANCHVPPLFTEPGWALHAPEEIGIDSFQADRSPDKRYRTTPLRGLFTRMKGGFYHDGRFATLEDVVKHYKSVLNFNLTEAEQSDLVEYLKSL